MARKSRLQGYQTGMQEVKERNRTNEGAANAKSMANAHSTPQSILARLKALKEQAAVITIPAGDAHEG